MITVLAAILAFMLLYIFVEIFGEEPDDE